MDNNSVIVLGFQFEAERYSLQDTVFNEDDENETEQ